MTPQLVFVHGIAQEYKNPHTLKVEWMAALRKGLKKNGLELPIPESSVRFPYYGQTLYGLGKGSSQVAKVVVRGSKTDNAERQFLEFVLKEIQQAEGITDDQVEEMLGREVVARNPLNWRLSLAILRAIDKHVPSASGAGIAIATKVVYQYLKNPGIRDPIDEGVSAALTPYVPSIIVAHSLGTVVAYNLLKRDGDRQHWVVPLLVTLGSPLAVTAIKRSLSPIKHPRCVAKWYNARDGHDTVGLYPLDKNHFRIVPEVENKSDVRNGTTNHHGISGYLDDQIVARRIYDALAR